jgi:Dolichyl-phosphate-mannose-protein mannosyltransferase
MALLLRLRPHVAATVTLLSLGVGAVVFLWCGWRAVGFPYPLDYGEGPLLDQALRIARGEGIYLRPGASPPWTVSNYPPVFVLLESPLTVLFGPAYWYGRLISWLATVASAVLAGSLVKTLTADRLASTITALILPVVPFIASWSMLARIDTLALAFSLAGLLCVVRWPHRIPAVLATALLLTAAIYTRQSYGLAAPLTALVWLLGGHRRHALLLVGAMAILGSTLAILLNSFTGGGFFFNIITANVNDLQWQLVSLFLGQTFVAMPVLIVVGALSVCLSGRFDAGAWRVVVPYSMAATLVALTIGKVGSNVNYLIELGAALSIAVGLLIAWLRPRPAMRQILLLVLAVQVALMLPPSGPRAAALQKMEDRDTTEALERVLAEEKGPVLADDAMGLLPLNGRSIELQPFEMTQLVRAGVWDQSPLLEAIDEQRYAAIFISRSPSLGDRWTPEMLEHVESTYEPRVKLKRTAIYEPRRG